MNQEIQLYSPCEATVHLSKVHFGTFQPSISPKLLALGILPWSNKVFILTQLTHMNQEIQLNFPCEATVRFSKVHFGTFQPSISLKPLALAILTWSKKVFILTYLAYMNQEIQLNSPFEATVRVSKVHFGTFQLTISLKPVLISPWEIPVIPNSDFWLTGSVGKATAGKR